MPDPTTHANAAAAAIPIVAASATAFSITLWPFGVAGIAGFLALIYLDRMPLVSSFFSIIGATLIGGTLAQISAIPALLLTKSFFPSLGVWADTAEVPMTLFIAIVIGLLCQKAMPALLNRTEKTIGGGS